jgi:siroheme synthase
VTGHKASDSGSEVKWRDLARSVDTIVILMSLQNLREIMRQLLKGGCEPGRPVALIQSGTRPSRLQWRESIIRNDTLIAGCEALEATPWTHCV